MWSVGLEIRKRGPLCSVEMKLKQAPCPWDLHVPPDLQLPDQLFCRFPTFSVRGCVLGTYKMMVLVVTGMPPDLMSWVPQPALSILPSHPRCPLS